MKKIAVFPGSFDPFTNGHTDIVLRSLEVFEEVVVAVLGNSQKQALFSVEERKVMIAEIFKDQPRVKVDSFTGLLVDYCAKVGASNIVRGLRATSDFDYEAQMALMNQKLANNIDTFFLMAREQNSYISSTLVKQVAPLGGDVSMLVSQVVVDKFKVKLGK